SGDLLSPSPPAEKASACEDQAGKASTDDGAGNGRGRSLASEVGKGGHGKTGRRQRNELGGGNDAERRKRTGSLKKPVRGGGAGRNVGGESRNRLASTAATEYQGDAHVGARYR